MRGGKEWGSTRLTAIAERVHLPLVQSAQGSYKMSICARIFEFIIVCSVDW